MRKTDWTAWLSDHKRSVRQAFSLVFYAGAFAAVSMEVSALTEDAGQTSQSVVQNSRKAGDAYLDSRGNIPRLRQFMEAFPKGGDLHNHLTGAVYAETWLDWAAEDGLCVDMTGPRLVLGEADCATKGYETAASVRADDDKRRQVINGLSVRSFVPYAGWSGHNQFFVTFFRMARAKDRFGDMLAAVAARAGEQNIVYLELMETLVLPEILPLVADVKMTGDAATDYKAIMASSFGSEMKNLLADIKSQISAGFARKDALLGCGTGTAQIGCDVEIRLQHQVIRSFDPASVYAQFILGWAAVAENKELVGLNLVAPEDGYVALRDYSQHMAMIDYLYQTEGARNVALHAGELTLGLVRPKQLKFHMWEAIKTGHAKRIGHGIDVAYERDSDALLAYMKDNDIPVEINLTSNDVILGVKGRAHPLYLYREWEVPYMLSTDDEGVSRIDLTHEYMRAAQTFDLPYFELKNISRNSLRYSFLPGTSIYHISECKDLIEKDNPLNEGCRKQIEASEKARFEWKLEEKFRAFEAGVRLKRERVRLYN